MSTDYTKMSDFEISCKVAKANNWTSKSFVHEIHSGKWNPCQNPADAWPIIVENRIRINPILYTKWMAEDYLEDVSSCDENPLRAAMIAFLMMQESKNAS
ncbi:hypothetical protein S13a_00026 [Klebsiella phage VLCpiS13a]|uniref:hypothetical protein n=1 Tax=Klebsiella phage VLCpiS13a TaxID=2874885 RepID=UPI00233ED34B|nr:hypothetical protein PRB89_gp75 [Klebsiella phage VLCpiS13a]UVX30232.1 hypothetical protein S13a_00026 [Klebsiella phage VLCpiS13a]